MACASKDPHYRAALPADADRGRHVAFPFEDAWTLSGLAFFGGRRLETVQEGDGALRVGRGREDRPLVVGEHLEPGTEIAGMIRTWLELRRDTEIGAEEAASELSSSRARSLRSLA